MPGLKHGQDEADLGIQLIKKFTGVGLRRDQIKNAHFMGERSLLVEFIVAGTMSPIGSILDPIHRQKMKLARTWINIHMRKEDKHLFYQARDLRRAGVVSKAFSNLQALTVVVKEGQKIPIRRVEDLQQLTDIPLADILRDDPHLQQQNGVHHNDSGFVEN